MTQRQIMHPAPAKQAQPRVDLRLGHGPHAWRQAFPGAGGNRWIHKDSPANVVARRL